MFMTIIASTTASMDPLNVQYLRATRKTIFGATLEELQNDEQWVRVEAVLGKSNGFLQKNEEGRDLLFIGEPGKITYSDFRVAAVLDWARTVHDEDSEDWKRVAGWHAGKWGRLLTQLS